MPRVSLGEFLLLPGAVCDASPLSVAGKRRYNRLTLDVYPDGCCRLLRLFEGQQAEVVQVELLRLSSNDHLLNAALSILPHLKRLKSLVLKGEFLDPIT
uniref:Uncharacterized protein n=1 Tax=Pavo cristatus TaxID=9049 RepID=A0A8C9F202_PAVCR